MFKEVLKNIFVSTEENRNYHDIDLDGPIGDKEQIEEAIVTAEQKENPDCKNCATNAINGGQCLAIHSSDGSQTWHTPIHVGQEEFLYGDSHAPLWCEWFTPTNTSMNTVTAESTIDAEPYVEQSPLDESVW